MENQAKREMKYNFIFVKMAITKKQDLTRIGENKEKRNLGHC